MKRSSEAKTTKATISPELTARAKAGDQAAFTELYEQTNAGLYRTIRAMVNDEDLAWDILQESYLRAFQNLDKLEANEAFLSWLRRIALNETASVTARSRSVSFSELSDEDGELPEIPDLRLEAQPELVIDQQESSRLVREILDELPEQQRIIVGMYYYEELSVKEIAALLQLAPGTVKAQLHNGRKRVELRVRALEKQGVKLYGLSPVAFLLTLLRRLEPAAAAEQKALGAIIAKAPVAAAGASAGAAAGTSTTITAMTAGQAFLQGLGAKIAAGALTVALIGGGIWAGGRLLKNQEQKLGDWQPTETQLAAPVETPAPVVTEPAVTEPSVTQPSALGQPVDKETEAELRALLDDDMNINPEAMGHYVRALTSEYAKPADADLKRLFDDFYGYLSDAERDQLRELLGDKLDDRAWAADREWAKLTGAELDTMLTELFGMDLAELAAQRGVEAAELLHFHYLPDFDCYYRFHTDCGLRSIRIQEILQADDGRIFVNYDYRDEMREKMTAVLRAVDGHYLILANLPRDTVLADPDAIGTETEPVTPAVPEPTEEELAALERELTGEYFVKLPVAERSYFSNGKTRIWDDNGTIMKKDLASGETETLFTLETGTDTVTTTKEALSADETEALSTQETKADYVIMLVGVTENRLYIGWNSADRYMIGGVLVVYSVDYQNRDEKLLMEERAEEYDRGEMQVNFRDGFLVLEADQRDVGARQLRVIDRNDQIIADVQRGWGEVVDDSFYFIYAPDLQEYAAWLETADEEARQHVRYELCRVDLDGSRTEIGSIDGEAGSYFYINTDAKEIIGQFPFDAEPDEYNQIHLDLFTLQPTTLEALAFDELDPDTPVGVGISPLRNDSEAIVFYTYFGAFGFDGTSGEPLFAVDFDKAFYGKGRNHTGCRISEDGTQLLLNYVENDVAETSEYCLIDLKAGTYHRSSAEPEGKFLGRAASGAVLPCRMDSESISGLCIPLNDEEFYPFREN